MVCGGLIGFYVCLLGEIICCDVLLLFFIPASTGESYLYFVVVITLCYAA